MFFKVKDIEILSIYCILNKMISDFTEAHSLVTFYGGCTV